MAGFSSQRYVPLPILRLAVAKMGSEMIASAGGHLEDHPRTCKWLITMVNKSPKDRVVGPLPNGLKGLEMGVILTAYKSWDEPPSKLAFYLMNIFELVGIGPHKKHSLRLT